MKMTVQSYFSIVPNLMKIHSFYVSLFFSCFLIVYYCLAFCLLESYAVTLGFFGVALIFWKDVCGLPPSHYSKQVNDDYDSGSYCKRLYKK